MSPFELLRFRLEERGYSPRVVRKLVDPNKSLLRKVPKSDDDLLIAASKSRVMTFENVSHLEPSLSDAICRLATGGARPSGCSIPTTTR